jgi:hypothetical protein
LEHTTNASNIVVEISSNLSDLSAALPSSGSTVSTTTPHLNISGVVTGSSNVVLGAGGLIVFQTNVENARVIISGIYADIAGTSSKLSGEVVVGGFGVAVGTNAATTLPFNLTGLSVSVDHTRLDVALVQPDVITPASSANWVGGIGAAIRIARWQGLNVTVNHTAVNVATTTSSTKISTTLIVVGGVGVSASSVFTRSQTASASRLPLPTPRRPPPSTLVQAGAIGMVGGGGAVLAGAAASTVGAVARTLGVATALSRIASGGGNCHAQDRAQPPARMDSPLQLTLGAPPDYVAGTAVGAPIMCVLLAVACGAASYVGTVVVRMLAAQGSRTARRSDGDEATSSVATPFVRAAEAACAGFLLGAAILTTPAVTAVVVAKRRT